MPPAMALAVMRVAVVRVMVTMALLVGMLGLSRLDPMAEARRRDESHAAQRDRQDGSDDESELARVHPHVYDNTQN
jgi:hypothetical protein